MILQRLAGPVVFSLYVLLYGCSSPPSQTVVPQQQTVRQAADVPAARVDASRPTVDPRQLPAPRAPLAGTPDLSGAAFQITDANLKEMTGAGMPAAEANKLNALKGREYGNVAEFRAVVEDRLGKPSADAHMGTVLRHALAVTLVDAPTPPEGRAELQAAETLKRPDTATPPATVAKAPAAAAAAVVILPGTMGSDKFRPVQFDTNKAAPGGEFTEAISFNANVLKGDKSLKIVIEGHCDTRGSSAYNMALGQRRAESVRSALAAAGVPDDQMKAVSYGEDRPAARGNSDAVHARNRRVVINLQ